MRKIFTSESVTEGHPDKLCDQVSDAILDAIIAKDKGARVACESFATTGAVYVMGEITTNAYVDIPTIVRNTVKRIGYVGSDMGFDANTCAVITSISEQSPDIAMGVNQSFESKESGGEEIGAGDQGLVFGYACNETDVYLPLPIYLAHKLARRLAYVRKESIVKGLRPDGKTQVSVVYEDGKPVIIDGILISSQHNPDLSMKKLKEDLWREVVLPVVDHKYLDSDTKFFVNPTGRFEIGGPHGDTGLTGRKIIVDAYGGFSRSGGGAFSGKDPTKVDRSASYYARYVAKNMVASGLCDQLEVGVSYAIGMAEPFSLYVDSFGTGKFSDEHLLAIVKKHFDFRPGRIIENLDLLRPIYEETACYGHFGRDDLDLPWERLDKVEALKKELD